MLDSPSSSSEGDKKETPTSTPKHLHFVLSLQDPTHNLRFTTVSQPVPGDWLDVEYDQSEWVEERLVDVIRIGVEIIAQDVRLPHLPASLPLSLLLTLCPPRNELDKHADPYLLVRRHAYGSQAVCPDPASYAETRARDQGRGIANKRDQRHQGRLTTCVSSGVWRRGCTGTRRLGPARIRIC